MSKRDSDPISSPTLFTVLHNGELGYYRDLTLNYNATLPTISKTEAPDDNLPSPITLVVPKQCSPLVSAKNMSLILNSLVKNKDWDIIYLDKCAKSSHRTWEILKCDGDTILELVTVRVPAPIRTKKLQKYAHLVRKKRDDDLCQKMTRVGYLRTPLFSTEEDNKLPLPFSYYLTAVVFVLLLCYAIQIRMSYSK